MKIGICNDHAGVEYKFKLVKMLEKRGIEVVNFGTDTEDSVDYPDYAHKLAQAVESHEVDLRQTCGSAQQCQRAGASRKVRKLPGCIGNSACLA